MFNLDPHENPLKQIASLVFKNQTIHFLCSITSYQDKYLDQKKSLYIFNLLVEMEIFMEAGNIFMEAGNARNIHGGWKHSCGPLHHWKSHV